MDDGSQFAQSPGTSLTRRLKFPALAAVLATLVLTLPLIVADIFVKPGYWGTEEDYCKDFWDNGGWNSRLAPRKRNKSNQLEHRKEWNSSFCYGSTSAEALKIARYQHNEYCEGIRVEAFVRTPANSWTAIVYIFGGGWCFGHGCSKIGSEGRILFLIEGMALILLGVGTFWFHATFKHWANDLDVGWMYGFANSAITTSIWRICIRWKNLAFQTSCSFAPFFTTWFIVTTIMYIGNAADIGMSVGKIFPVQLSIIIFLEAILVFTQLCFKCAWPVFCKDFWVGISALGCFATGLVLWNVGKAIKDEQERLEVSDFCNPDSLIQPHAMWHTLTGIALWSLTELQATPLPPGAAWEIGPLHANIQSTCKRLNISMGGADPKNPLSEVPPMRIGTDQA